MSKQLYRETFEPTNSMFISQTGASRLQDTVHLIYFYLYNNTFREVHFIGINHNKLCYSLKRLIF